MLEGYKCRNPKCEIDMVRQKGESISISPLWTQLEEQLMLGGGAEFDK